jgi:predicted nucleotidyltransferase
MQMDVSPYIVRLKQRQVSRKFSLKRRHDKAWERARTAAEFLRNAYGAKRVAVFGSVAQTKLFHPGSDVDLVVWGLHPGLYFRAVGQLQGLDPGIPIDLVMFEDAPESLKRVILEEGVDL